MVLFVEDIEELGDGEDNQLADENESEYVELETSGIGLHEVIEEVTLVDLKVYNFFL